jgi:hypothetical protein
MDEPKKVLARSWYPDERKQKMMAALEKRLGVADFSPHPKTPKPYTGPVLPKVTRSRPAKNPFPIKTPKNWAEENGPKDPLTGLLMGPNYRDPLAMEPLPMMAEPRSLMGEPMPMMDEDPYAMLLREMGIFPRGMR